METRTVRYTCFGSVRGGCGIVHKSYATAAAHCDYDLRACKRGHGASAYSDRYVIRTDGQDMTAEEMRQGEAEYESRA